jgi:hypothetical protein
MLFIDIGREAVNKFQEFFIVIVRGLNLGLDRGVLGQIQDVVVKDRLKEHLPTLTGKKGVDLNL